MFQTSNDLGSEIIGVTRDTFTGTSGWVIFLLGLVLAFFVIELIINWINRGKE